MNYFDHRRALRKLAKRQLAEELRTAFYARNACRFEVLLKTLDPKKKPTPGLKPDLPHSVHKEEATP